MTITFNITFDRSLYVSNSTVRADMTQNYVDLMAAITSAANLTVLRYESLIFSTGSIVATSELTIIEPPKNDVVISLINSTFVEDPTVVALAKSLRAVSVGTDAREECSEGGRTTCNSAFSECLAMDAFPGFECKCQLGDEFYCQNGATCSHTASQNPNCLCTQWYQGERCESLNGGLIAGVVIGILAGIITIAVALVVLWVRVCRTDSTGFPHKEKDLPGVSKLYRASDTNDKGNVTIVSHREIV